MCSRSVPNRFQTVTDSATLAYCHKCCRSLIRVWGKLLPDRTHRSCCVFFIVVPPTPLHFYFASSVRGSSAFNLEVSPLDNHTDQERELLHVLLPNQIRGSVSRGTCCTLSRAPTAMNEQKHFERLFLQFSSSQ